jgi:pimeloyl-ACP methyl ester carboxylesterase
MIGTLRTSILGTVTGVSAPPYLELPEGVRTGRIRTERADFAVLEAGASGPRVVLVPGWTGSKEDFVAVMAPLAEAGYRVVAIDQRGQYETAGSALESDYTLPALTDDLIAIIDGIGRPVHLVGHSFGGLVARRVAIAEPEAVASLTLLGSGPGPVRIDSHALLQAMADAIPAIGLPATWEAKRAYERAQGGVEPPPEIERFMQTRFLANHPLSIRAMTLHLTTAEDVVDALAGAGVPILVAFGVDDDGWPIGDQRAMADRMGAPVAVIDGAGHSPAAEQPERTVAVLTQFWSTLDEAATRHSAPARARRSS